VKDRDAAPFQDAALEPRQAPSVTTAAPPAVARVLALQSTAGNLAVTRMLKGDAVGPAQAVPPPPPPAPSASAAPAGPETEAQSDAPQEDQTGEIEPIEGEAITTGGCDAPLRRLDAALPGGGDVKVNPTLDLHVSHREVAASGPGRPDAVNHALTVGSQLTEDASAPGPGEFGVEKVKYKVDNIKWTHHAAAKTVDVNARIFLDITWGVHSLGRTDVPSPTDAIVKKDTWKAIADDLRPDGTGRPTRDKYWAQDLTRKHENFHATDDIGRANLYLPTARTWLTAQSVSAGSVEADVKALLETMRGNVEADGWAWYGTGGEDRAYADGKSSYAGRVTAIEAAAVTNKW
jgi:hypothetical protein